MNSPFRIGIIQWYLIHLFISLDGAEYHHTEHNTRFNVRMENNLRINFRELERQKLNNKVKKPKRKVHAQTYNV